MSPNARSPPPLPGSPGPPSPPSVSGSPQPGDSDVTAVAQDNAQSAEMSATLPPASPRPRPAGLFAGDAFPGVQGILRPEPADPPPPPMLDDSAFAAGRARRRRYRILERVGQGSEAKVSAALSLDTGRMVAIKVSRKPVPGIACPTEQARTFAAIAALKHPNIVEMIEQFETESKSYTVMELAAGDLETFLQCRGPLGEAEIRTILASILRALCFLHSRGIAHRDLKPRNILLRSFDDLSTLCISDFGGAHVPMGPLFPPPGVPTMHRIVGTPLYLAPEIVRGQTPYSAEVDLWSLGCIAYQLAWGRTPFGDSDSLLHLFARAIGGRWSFPTGARQGAFADFVAALLRPDPEGRISAEGALEHPWMKGVPVVDGPMYSPAPMPAIEALEVMGGEKGDTRRFSRISV